jgi:hypothetical protein
MAELPPGLGGILPVERAEPRLEELGRLAETPHPEMVLAEVAQLEGASASARATGYTGASIEIGAQ